MPLRRGGDGRHERPPPARCVPWSLHHGCHGPPSGPRFLWAFHPAPPLLGAPAPAVPGTERPSVMRTAPVKLLLSISLLLGACDDSPPGIDAEVVGPAEAELGPESTLVLVVYGF